MRVGIIGSRDCANFHVDRLIKYIPAECTAIVSGGARGIDALAAQAAEKLGLFSQCYLPDYERYGKNAPLIRNKKIVEHSDLVLAFWDFKSRGTAHTIVQCIEQHTEVKIIGLDQESDCVDIDVLLNSID